MERSDADGFCGFRPRGDKVPGAEMCTGLMGFSNVSYGRRIDGPGSPRAARFKGGLLAALPDNETL